MINLLVLFFHQDVTRKLLSIDFKCNIYNFFNPFAIFNIGFIVNWVYSLNILQSMIHF